MCTVEKRKLTMCIEGTGGRIRKQCLKPGEWCSLGLPVRGAGAARWGCVSSPPPTAGEDGLAFPLMDCLLGRSNNVTKH